MGVHPASGSLADEEAAASLRNERNKSAWRGPDAPAEAGQLVDAAFSISDTVLSDRTNAAPGLSWCADERAEFHQGLVELGTGAGGVVRGAWCVRGGALARVGFGGLQHQL
jgi:hypothetical protein